jgi:hypothetical protein
MNRMEELNKQGKRKEHRKIKFKMDNKIIFLIVDINLMVKVKIDK